MAERVPTLPPPQPKLPPKYPDLYGRRRELAKVQMLEREISFLEGEMKYVESLQPASRNCKEVTDFVVASSDPLMPIREKTSRSCCFWKWICRAPCLFLSNICCFGCYAHLKRPQYFDCNTYNICHICVNCTLPKCQCCPWPWWRCFGNTSCYGKCCLTWCSQCSECSCQRRCSCPKINLCFCCRNNCCYSCWVCY